ncbi:MAG: LPS assembly lipoprotein LptE [Pseudolabrys sp.]
MWWPDLRAFRLSNRRFIRFAAVLAIAGLTAGCSFQPLYGDRTGPTGENTIVAAMRSVDVAELKTPRGTRIDRVGVALRNDIIFALTGGAERPVPTHRLAISLTSSQQQIIVDIQSGRPDIQNYTLYATYTLTDLATGKLVVNSSIFAPVSYDIPGQQQRFAGERGLRDAENRAAQVIAENIRNRLASYFIAGT